MNIIIDQLIELPTACLSDAMEGLNNLDPLIKPIKEHDKVAGRAFTVKMPVGDNSMVLKAIKEAKPGDVLVIDAKGDTYRAIAGDFVVALAQKLGLAGIVVDGVIRDINEIRSLDFPVFCKGTTVAACYKKGEGEINVPISCGGVSISPGDIIVGDADGVLAIPQEIVHQVVVKGKEKEARDVLRAQTVLKDRQSAREYLENLFNFIQQKSPTSTSGGIHSKESINFAGVQTPAE